MAWKTSFLLRSASKLLSGKTDLSPIGLHCCFPDQVAAQWDPAGLCPPSIRRVSYCHCSDFCSWAVTRRSKWVSSTEHLCRISAISSVSYLPVTPHKISSTQFTQSRCNLWIFVIPRKGHGCSWVLSEECSDCCHRQWRATSVISVPLGFTSQYATNRGWFSGNWSG